MLMFSQGALVLVAMERFLRLILGSEVAPGQTLQNLLGLAFSDRLELLDPPSGDRAKVTPSPPAVRLPEPIPTRTWGPA